MTTVMQLYMRASALVLFILVMLFAMAMLAAPALAQDAPAVPETDFIDLIFSTTSAAVGVLVALIWAAINPPPWLRAIADFITTKEALNWEHLLTSGLDRAEAAVRAMGIDALKDRNKWLNAMAIMVNDFNPEIVKYFDKNNNGVIDMLEGYLPPKGITPGVVALVATRLPPGSVPPTKAVSTPPFPSDLPAKRRRTEAVQ